MAAVAGREAEARAIRRDSICKRGQALESEDEKGVSDTRDSARTLAVAGAKCGRVEMQLACVDWAMLVNVVGDSSR